MLFYVTLLPSLLILVFIIRSDKFPEPNHLIFKTFFIGILLCIPAGIINSILITDDSLSLIAGFTEEPLKFAALYLYIKNKMDFNEPMDAIVYGTLISLGFATLENFDYVYTLSGIYEQEPMFVAVARAFTAIPLHAICGVIMGFYFGLYIFEGKGRCLLYSILIPIIIHVIYNLITVISLFLLVFYMIILLYYVMHLHGIYKKEQLKKIKEF